jgi:hypothetical protein
VRAALVFAVAFTAYAWTASPSIGTLDAPELTAAAACLGVPHSPGEPTVAMVGRAAQLLPVGDLSLRMSVASGLAGALAAALLSIALARILAFAAPAAAPRAREVVAASGALALAFSDAAWLQAARPEVYALTLCWVAAALVFVTADLGRKPRAGAVFGAGLAIGLGGATHHFIVLGFALPVAGWLLARRPGWRALAWGGAGTLLGLLAYVYLPLRALHDPLVNWGDPRTLGRLAWTISARAFQKALAPGAHVRPFVDDLGQTAGAMLLALGPLLLLALLGKLGGLRARSTRGLTLTVGAIIALGVLSRAALGFDWDNPDARGYLLPAVLGGVVLATLGAAVVMETLAHAGRSSWSMAVICAALPLWGLCTAAPERVVAAADRSADRWASVLAATPPPRAVVVTSYFETAFQLWALAVVDGARPDVQELDRGFAAYPGMIETTARRLPDLAALVRSPLSGGHPTPLAAIEGLARPVLFELADSLDAPLVRHLDPGPFWARYVQTPPDDATLAARERLRPPLAPGAPAGALWHELARARSACLVGHSRTAAVDFARLAAALPDDELVAAERARCR